MSSTAVSTTQDFQERMFASIRDKMGDLLTDDDLKRIIEAAVQRGFFEDKVVEGSYGSRTRDEAVFVKLVREEVRAQAEVAIAAWLRENESKVVDAINECIGRGFIKIIADYLDQKASAPLWQFAENLKQQGVLR